MAVDGTNVGVADLSEGSLFGEPPTDERLAGTRPSTAVSARPLRLHPVGAISARCFSAARRLDAARFELQATTMASKLLWLDPTVLEFVGGDASHDDEALIKMEETLIEAEQRDFLKRSQALQQGSPQTPMRDSAAAQQSPVSPTRRVLRDKNVRHQVAVMRDVPPAARSARQLELLERLAPKIGFLDRIPKASLRRVRQPSIRLSPAPGSRGMQTTFTKLPSQIVFGGEIISPNPPPSVPESCPQFPADYFFFFFLRRPAGLSSA